MGTIILILTVNRFCLEKVLGLTNLWFMIIMIEIPFNILNLNVIVIFLRFGQLF